MQIFPQKYVIQSNNTCTFDCIETLLKNKIIGENTVVRVQNSINFSGRILNKIPVRFGDANGFHAIGCGLTSLVNSPKRLSHSFNCSDNKLKNLVGGPIHVQQVYDCSNNPLESFDGFPNKVAKFKLDNCNIKSLVGIHRSGLQYCESMSFFNNPIEEGGLGLIFIPGLRRIDCQTNKEIFLALRIIVKYLRTGKDGLLACQQELIEAGLEQYAKL